MKINVEQDTKTESVRVGTNNDYYDYLHAYRIGELNRSEFMRFLTNMHTSHHYTPNSGCSRCSLGLLHICSCGERYFCHYRKDS